MFNKWLIFQSTDALRPVIPNNACIPCIAAAAGTKLADARTNGNSSFPKAQ